MPVFPLQCEQCNAETEEWLKHSDPLPPCASCGGPQKRLIAGTTHFRLRSKGGDVGGAWSGSQYSRYRNKTEGV